MSVLWFAQPLAQREFSRLVNEDFLVAFASVLFVWCYLMYHLGSCFVGSMAMLQISVSLPLSLFFYRVVFRISYFAGMQILVVFVILGIGADDRFAMTQVIKNRDNIEQICAEKLGQRVRLEGVVQQGGETAEQKEEAPPESDPTVRSVLDTFDGELV